MRLSLGYALWMALLFCGIGVGVYKLVERNLNQSVDAALIASAESLRSARAFLSYRSPFTQSFLREFFGENYIRPYAQLVDLSGRVSARTQNLRVSLPVTPYATSRAERGISTLETIPRRGMAPLRQITVPVVQGGRFTGELVQVGAPLDPAYRTLNSIGLMLWVVLPVGLLLSLIFGYFLMGWSLKPVAAVSRTVANLGSDDLNLRLDLPPAKDEIRELSQTFNGMLDRLQDAFSRMKRFAGDVSHELRTPLTVLRGEAEFALRRERTPDEYRQSLQAIGKEAVHMTSIVEDLLLLARAQSKSVALNWERFSLRQFVTALQDTVVPYYLEKGVTLVIPEFKDTHAYLSGGFMSLALKNILLNAAKHSPQGSKVFFGVFVHPKHVAFRIEDQGEGIPQNALPYIFDAFYRADTARNRAAGGTGIGLSLAQALIALHEGRVCVESEVGKGTVFTVTIPFYQEHPQEQKPDLEAAERSRRLGLPIRAKSPRIVSICKTQPNQIEA